MFPRAITLWERRLLALMLALFILRDLPWRLDEYDQAKQAFTSLEMVDGGAWWFQHTPGCRALATKPPLVGWMSAAIYELCGGNYWDLAWRLPSLLAAVALVILVWRAGERLWPGLGGTLAAAAFGFNVITPRLAMLVRTDAVLALWITLLGLIVWRHVREGGKPWTTPDRWSVFVLMLATMMTKGPIVYAFLLPGMVVHWWVSRRRGETAVATVWGGWWHWTLPLLPFLLWLERGIVTVPGFREEVVGHEFLGRFTVGENAVHHNQAVWFYAAQLLVRWLPWSALLLAVGVRAKSVWKELWREPGTRWLLCWAAGGLIALSLVPSKRTDRIFPVVPPLCLVLTALVVRAQKQEETPSPGTLVQTPPDALWPRRWATGAVAVSAVLAAATTLAPTVRAYWRREGARAAFGASVRAAAGARRYELVVGKGWTADEESMLLYLRRLRFLRPVDAVQQASTGKLDAIVINEQALALEHNAEMLTPYFPAKPELVSKGASPHFQLLSRPSPTPTPTPTLRPPKAGGRK